MAKKSVSKEIKARTTGDERWGYLFNHCRGEKKFGAGRCAFRRGGPLPLIFRLLTVCSLLISLWYWRRSSRSYRRIYGPESSGRNNTFTRNSCRNSGADGVVAFIIDRRRTRPRL